MAPPPKKLPTFFERAIFGVPLQSPTRHFNGVDGDVVFEDNFCF